VRNALVVVNENHFGRWPYRVGPVSPKWTRKTSAQSILPPGYRTPASFVLGRAAAISLQRRFWSIVVPLALRNHRAESASGVERKTGERQSQPAPRIVTAPHADETLLAWQRPPFGQSKVERPTTDLRSPPASEG